MPSPEFTSATTNAHEALIEVSPERLAHGRWCAESEKRIGEGDIVGSYSADTIGMAGKLRRTFSIHGALWVTTSTFCGEAEAYRVVPVTDFKEPVTTYGEKVAIEHGEFARGDPMGFYHSMRVDWRGRSWVLCGPPETMTPATGTSTHQQGLLFDL